MKKIIPAILQDLSPLHLMGDHVSIKDHSLQLFNQRIDLNSFSSIFPLGVGKAAAAQTEALIKALMQYDVLAKKLVPGLVITKDHHDIESPYFKCFTSSHPIPDHRGLDNTKHLIQEMQKMPAETLLLVCLSGGASALLELPASGFDLPMLQQITDYLLQSGASIEEINSIRQILSQVKNGGLPAFCNAKRIEVLVTSDVSSNNLRFIGSGPFHYEPIDVKRTEELIKSNFPQALASTILDHLYSPLFQADEEAKERAQHDKEIHHQFILDWKTLFKLAEQNCQKLYPHHLLFTATYPHQGSFKQGLDWHLKAIAKLVKDNRPFIIISGGELPVVVKGKGLGGRNTHFALALGSELFDKNSLNLTPDQLGQLEVLSLATDGSDGPTDGAGATLDYQTVHSNKQFGVNIQEYLDRYDSYHYFEKTGTLVKTGPTGSNVMDLRIIRYGK